MVQRERRAAGGMLRGHAKAKLDGKGRFRIPAELVDGFLSLCDEDRQVFVTTTDGERVSIFPLPVWVEHEKKLAAVPSTEPALAPYQRLVSFYGRQAAVDKQGRLLIHPLLREVAAIDSNDSHVAVIGKQKILEVCDFEKFKPRALTREELSRLAQYGI